MQNELCVRRKKKTNKKHSDKRRNCDTRGKGKGSAEDQHGQRARLMLHPLFLISFFVPTSLRSS